MVKKKSSKKDSDMSLDISFLSKIKFEWIFLVVFLGVLLNFMSVYDVGLLKHDKGPTNYLANDMFAFAAYADLAKYEDDVTLQPDYMAAGKTDAVNFFSMQGAYIAAELSQFTGIESYDFIIHLNLIFIVFSILMIYQFLTKIDTKLAIFSLPLSLLVFKWPFMYTITWGMHLSNVNMLFIAASLLCLYYIDRKYIFIVLGILNGAGVLAHAREFLMFNLGVAIYFGIRLIKEKTIFDLLKKPSKIKKYILENKTGISLKNYILSIPITLIIMFRHLPVLGAIQGSGSTSTIYGANGLFAYIPPSKFHHVFFEQFGFYKFLIFIGLALGIYFLLTKKMRKVDIIVSFCLIFLISGFFSILGNKTSQIRHIFPVLIMPLVGLAIFMLYNYLKNLIKINPKIIFTSLFLLLLIPTMMSHSPDPISEFAFSDPYTWEAIKWVRENVPEDETILNLYGDRHNQPRMFQLMRKIHFNAPAKDYLEKVSNAVLTSNHMTDWGLVHFYMTQPKFNELITVTTGEIRYEIRSICEFNYVYLDKVSKYEQVIAYNSLIVDRLKNKNNFSEVYENQLVLILENKEVGQNCFEDEVLR